MNFNVNKNELNTIGLNTIMPNYRNNIFSYNFEIYLLLFIQVQKMK